jgi:predicted extracellular nuclease
MYIPPKIVLIVIIILVPFLSFSQPQRGDFRILFYNVENLFDVSDDPLINDEEYLPGGERYWSFERFQKKLNNIAKVIITAGGWEAPEIVGLCEVENRYVVEQLLNTNLLGKINYRIIHKESPDRRGIDVSIIYKSDKFKPIKYEYIPILNLDSLPISTREILYVAGIPEETSDTIHLFVNHWPSRFGGFLETAGLREQAAKTLRCAIVNLFKEFRNPKIIIMGDFNDQPSDESISKILVGSTESEHKGKTTLINLFDGLGTNNLGTIKYQSQWLVYDQIIVSESLLDSSKNVYCTLTDAHIFKNNFLLEKDMKYGGYKPFRTYTGFNYNGGFSDHFPVYLDLFFK